MARLRVRVELNRGGVGVPLNKLASVVQESQRFFEMLAQDVHIEKERGEWLAFDFDNESLNFTAEYVGPVSVEQVGAFTSAFDGITSLRRGTIAQFTRIADAIGEDELIGFGLYQSEQEIEPSEWRCLSRRDALRIADEIQLLLGVSGELEQETHLPAVIDAGVGARLFKERHDRNLLSAEHAKWPNLIREVESSLAKRISKLEGEVESHSSAIHDIREASAGTEESFRSLLSAVENFCGQATRQLERMSPPAQLPPAPEAPAPPPAPAHVESSAPVELSSAVAASDSGRNWRALTVAAIVVVGIASTGFFLWTSKTAEPGNFEKSAVSAAGPVDSGVSKASPVGPLKQKERVEKAAPAATPLQTKPEKKLDQPAQSAATNAAGTDVMHVDIEAKEPVWVAVTDADGNTLMARTLQANETRSLELTKAATLRTGNAGGLVVRFNGKEIGPLGPNGKIRDVEFKGGNFKIVTPDVNERPSE